MAIQHEASCTSDYPERPPQERVQTIMELALEDGKVLSQCLDCGAFEVLPGIADGSAA